LLVPQLTWAQDTYYCPKADNNEGMQLDDPSNTPDIWKGPLPIPQPTTPACKSLIKDITEDILIEPQTLNTELEVPYPEDLYMDINLDPDPPERPLILEEKLSPVTTTETWTSPSPGEGGAFIPVTWPMVKKKKKVLPPIQPRMKKGGIENL
jgi:hypothetical protein